MTEQATTAELTATILNVRDGLAQLLTEQERRREERWERMEAHLTRLETRLDEQQKRSDWRYDRINRERDDLAATEAAHYNEATMRLNSHDERLDDIERRIVRLEHRVKRLEELKIDPLTADQLNEIGNTEL